jgi:hypothetical protein
MESRNKNTDFCDAIKNFQLCAKSKGAVKNKLVWSAVSSLISHYLPILSVAPSQKHQ